MVPFKRNPLGFFALISGLAIGCGSGETATEAPQPVATAGDASNPYGDQTDPYGTTSETPYNATTEDDPSEGEGGGAGEGETVCEVGDEAGHSLGAATHLTDVKSGDKTADDVPTTSGTLAGTEPNYYSYHGQKDILSGIIDPAVESISSNGDIEVCEFFEWLNGNDYFPKDGCPGGTYEATDSGLKGCCGSQDFIVDARDSGFEDSSANVYIRVSSPSAHDRTCIDYTFRYHF